MLKTKHHIQKIWSILICDREMKPSHLAVNFEFRACSQNIRKILKLTAKWLVFISRSHKRTDHIFSEKNLNYCTQVLTNVFSKTSYGNNSILPSSSFLSLTMILTSVFLVPGTKFDQGQDLGLKQIFFKYNNNIYNERFNKLIMICTPK